MTHVEHDWVKNHSWSDQRWCRRCGLYEIERERNLPSQSTHLYVAYWRDGKSLPYDPGCCEREEGK